MSDLPTFAGTVPSSRRTWLQTWVDNTGAHLDCVGGWLGDRMVLQRATDEGNRQRMTWHSIATDRLVWDWESRPSGAGSMGAELAAALLAYQLRMDGRPLGHDQGLSSG